MIAVRPVSLLTERMQIDSDRGYRVLALARGYAVRDMLRAA